MVESLSLSVCLFLSGKDLRVLQEMYELCTLKRTVISPRRPREHIYTHEIQDKHKLPRTAARQSYEQYAAKKFYTIDVVVVVFVGANGWKSLADTQHTKNALATRCFRFSSIFTTDERNVRASRSSSRGRGRRVATFRKRRSVALTRRVGVAGPRHSAAFVFVCGASIMVVGTHGEAFRVATVKRLNLLERASLRRCYV